MTDRETFLCPHGVDVMPRLRVEPESAPADFVTETIKYTYDQNHCLKCQEDHGIVTVFNLYGSAGR